jgi:uncharacterized protein (TIGR02246 family)
VTRQEIFDLYAAYCHAIDDGDAREWAALFTRDGEFIGPGRPILTGRDQLTRFIEGRDARGIQHLTCNIRVRDSTPPETRVDADFVILTAGPDGNSATVTAMGRYHDTLRVEEERLRFARRKVTRIV